MPPFEQVLRAVQKTVEEFKKPDMLYTVSQGILFLTPLSTRAEAWLDETLLDWTMVDGTVSVEPELIDAAVEALAGSGLRCVSWRRRVIKGQQIPGDKRKRLLESLLRYHEVKRSGTDG